MSSPTAARARTRHATIAITTGVIVGLAAVAATFASGSLGAFAPIAAPAGSAAVIAALLAHRLARVPLMGENLSIRHRLAATSGVLLREQQERTILRELDKALDQAASEADAIGIIEAAFSRHLGGQPIELHLVDAIDPVLRLAIAYGDFDVQPAVGISPWDAVAAGTNKTLVYDTTDRVDACPHLKSRVENPMAAAAVPLNVAGQLLGVMYGFAPAGQPAGADDVAFLEDLANVIATRIALLRTVNNPPRAEAIDRLTGLPDRRSMQDRVLRLIKDRQPFSVAVADIDGFAELNATEGREAGDTALQILARVARRSIRPDDVVGRIGGDELLFILPRTHPDDATRALERLREELVLARSATGAAPLTLSIGVIGSSTGSSIEEILHRAAGALNHAKSKGGNRVVVAQSTGPKPRG